MLRAAAIPSRFVDGTRPDPVRYSGLMRFMGLGREDSPTRNAVIAVAATVLAAWTVRPIGWTGRPLAVALLLVVNCALLLLRVVPDFRLSPQRRLPLMWLGVGTTAALLAVGGSGGSALFGFFFAGHAGYRFPSTRSVPLAVAYSVVDGGVLLLELGPGHTSTPWFVGALSGFAVLFGMVNRSREELVRSLVTQADTAERAAQAEARETILSERGRIARDVHDVLAHSLAAISMQLNLANALLDKGQTAQAREITGRVQGMVRDSLIEAQRTVKDLREDSLPVVRTLRALSDSAVPPAEFAVHGDEQDLGPDVSQTVVRMAQESLTNAHKHAPGAEVRVTVGYLPDAVTLEIVNGRGSAAGELASAGSGLGLVGMRERVAAVNGSVSAGPITDGPDAGGWRVSARVPR